ncbi:MAG: DUF4115 domain-containing protein [Rhodoferax sp.]|uniref:helix-turn-helix domain-containing protein n=1 Tax=Rhodoferax sp. TaxID=50421 RepID=UPI0013FF712F|nr:helix-turn-helix domain-containing protein [Rhodoferax sp.]NDP37779.1 DUF4115 domain-containing protein [Rhodoferax sp.]
MSESVLPVTEDAIDAPDAFVPVSAGAMLRTAREAQGLHIGALAVALKVPVGKLEALEADRLDLLPDIVFVRALAASICRTLHVDAAPILEKLPRSAAPLLKTDESGINTPFRPSSDGLGLPFWHQLSKPFVLAVLALLMGIAALVLFPFIPRTEVAGALQSTTAVTTVRFSTPDSPPTEEAMPADAAASGLADSLIPSGSESPSAPIPDIAAPSDPSPVSATPLSTDIVPGSGAKTGLLIFTARGSSWIEVIDASGVVQVRQTLSDREVVGASGALPLSVVVGRADATDVQVRGKSFDLTAIAKNNVARFEVK